MPPPSVSSTHWLWTPTQRTRRGKCCRKQSWEFGTCWYSSGIHVWNHGHTSVQSSLAAGNPTRSLWPQFSRHANSSAISYWIGCVEHGLWCGATFVAYGRFVLNRCILQTPFIFFVHVCDVTNFLVTIFIYANFVSDALLSELLLKRCYQFPSLHRKKRVSPKIQMVRTNRTRYSWSFGMISVLEMRSWHSCRNLPFNPPPPQFTKSKAPDAKRIFCSTPANATKVNCSQSVWLGCANFHSLRAG